MNRMIPITTLFLKTAKAIAEDANTSFADDSERLVRIIGLYQLPQNRFDPKANLVVMPEKL